VFSDRLCRVKDLTTKIVFAVVMTGLVMSGIMASDMILNITSAPNISSLYFLSLVPALLGVAPFTLFDRFCNSDRRSQNLVHSIGFTLAMLFLMPIWSLGQYLIVPHYQSVATTSDPSPVFQMFILRILMFGVGSFALNYVLTRIRASGTKTFEIKYSPA
jgi:hypothetical protein